MKIKSTLELQKSIINLRNINRIHFVNIGKSENLKYSDEVLIVAHIDNESVSFLSTYGDYVQLAAEYHKYNEHIASIPPQNLILDLDEASDFLIPALIERCTVKIDELSTAIDESTNEKLDKSWARKNEELEKRYMTMHDKLVNQSKHIDVLTANIVTMSETLKLISTTLESIINIK